MYFLYILGEAFVVGAFCSLIYLGLSWIQPFLLLLFVLGIVKHGLGYYSGLQSLYCNYGQACKYPFPTEAHTHQILVESILEGIVFVLCGLFLYKLKSKMVAVFLLGFLLHLLVEVAGLHERFCEKNCRKL